MASITEISSQLKSIKSGINKIKPANELIKYIEDVRATVEDDYEDAADWLDNIADEIKQWYTILQDSTQLAESAGSIVEEANDKATKAEKDASEKIAKAKKNAEAEIAEAKQEAAEKVAKAKKEAQQKIDEAEKIISEAGAKIAKAEKEARQKIDGAEAEINEAKQKAISEATAKIAKAEKEAQQKIDGAEAEINAAKQKANAEVTKAQEEAAAVIAGVGQQIQTEVAKLTAELQKATTAAQQEAKEAKLQADEAKEKLNSFNKDLATLSETLVTTFGVEAPTRPNLRSLITMVGEIRFIDPKTVKKETVDLATVIGEKFADTLIDFTPRTATLSGLKTTIEELEVISAANHKRLQRYTDQAIAAFKEKFGNLMLDEDSLRSAKDLKTAIDDLDIPNPREIKQLKQKVRECVTEFIAKFGDDTELTTRSGLDELCQAIRAYCIPKGGGVAPEEIQRYKEQISIIQQALTESKAEITNTIKAYRNKFGAACGLTEYATLIELRQAIEQYIAPQANNDEVKILKATNERINKEIENACNAFVKKFGTSQDLIFNKSIVALTDAIKNHVTTAPTPDTCFEDRSVHFFNELWKDANRAFRAKKQGQLNNSEIAATLDDLSNRCDTSQVYIKKLSEKIHAELKPQSIFPTAQDTELLAAIRDRNVVQSARLLMDPSFVNGCSKKGIQEALIHAQERSEMKGLTVLIQGLINRMS